MPVDEHDRVRPREGRTPATAPETDGSVDGIPKPRRKVKAPPRRGVTIRPDLEGKQTLQGSHVGDRYVRVIRQTREEELKRIGPDYLVAGEDASAGRSGLGRTLGRVKRILIGQPLTTASAIHERLTKVKALAVLSSDALSSVAYATEEILRILLLAGVAAMSLSLPIAGAIIALLVIVGVSYRQTIKAYPHGGGSYIVAKDNLGEIPALVAGGSLLVAYILTVSVSISAAVAALVSAVPEMQDHLVAGGLAFILLVTILNLRGIRESGSIFAAPTYLFLAGIATMLAIGFVRNALNGFEVAEPRSNIAAGTGSVTILLILRAFASGCAALTGVEAISDGVPAFKPPEWKNARTTLTVMIAMLAVMFGGITFLAHQYGAAPLSPHGNEYETVVSQIARAVFGGTNAAYYFIQFST
ncbi:MAG TPA: APC family permease, partial [Thermomicrobiales bacterium]|nr:APC family permease [Thermomicrobiales bacterium]